MKWKATHFLKVNGARSAPIRVMLNSGDFYTKKQWDEQWAGQWTPSITTAGLAYAVDMASGQPDVTRTATVKPIGESGAGSHTPLRSEVTRMCTSFTVRRAGKVRRVAVTLAPGDVLIMREEGTRKKNARMLPFSEAWAVAGLLAAQKLKAERKAKRKARRAA